jgi:hypothetical protein
MNYKLFAPVVLLAGTVLAPVAFPAPTSESCTPGKPGPASYTWNFRQEASRLLNRIQIDSEKASTQADRLVTDASENDLSWQAHADKLASIRRDVNDMGRKICRLEQIRRMEAPWQQKALDRSYPLVRLMADNTTDALNYLRANEKDLWRPVYRKYAENLYNESAQLSQSLKAFDEYAQARTEDAQLAHNLGL